MKTTMPPHVGTWITVGMHWRPDLGYIGYGLATEPWSAFCEGRLAPLPRRLGGREFVVYLRAPFPVRPGRVPWRAWSELPSHLRYSIGDVARHIDATGQRIVWYVGTPREVPRLEDIEAELLPIVLVGGVETIGLDGMRHDPWHADDPHRSGRILEVYGRFADRWGVDLIVEPWCADPGNPGWREYLRGMTCIDIRWEHIIDRLDAGVIEPIDPASEHLVTYVGKGLTGLTEQQRHEIQRVRAGLCLRAGIRSILVDRWDEQLAELIEHFDAETAAANAAF